MGVRAASPSRVMSGCSVAPRPDGSRRLSSAWRLRKCSLPGLDPDQVPGPADTRPRGIGRVDPDRVGVRELIEPAPGVGGVTTAKPVTQYPPFSRTESRSSTNLVLLAAGVRPETSLAAAAGLALGGRGALLVDEHLRTSVPSIYGVGDAIEVANTVTGGPALVPLAGAATGRAARPLTTYSAAADGAHPFLARPSCASWAPWPPPPAPARRRCARPASPGQRPAPP